MAKGHILYYFLLISGAMQRSRDLSDLWVVYLVLFD
jgi:hypothetical protein